MSFLVTSNSGLSDPRQFSTEYPQSNILINQACYELAAAENNSLLVALLEDCLKQQQDSLISVAYNLAPSAAVSAWLWGALGAALNSAPRQLFVIPVVITVGSSAAVTLPTQVDQQRLQQLLLDKQVFSAATDAIISGTLYDLDGLAKTKLAEIYQLQQSAAKLEDFDFSRWSSAAIHSNGEQVHLRFLCGIGNRGAVVKANFAKLGLELFQLLSHALETPAATIFPLPFAVVNFNEAGHSGAQAWNEIAISLRLSAVVKKLRLERSQPQLRLAASNSQIQIMVYAGASCVTTLVWQLERADDFAHICQILADLFAEMQLEVSYVSA